MSRLALAPLTPLALAALWACSGKDADTEPGTDSTPVADTCVDDDGCDAGQICEAGACIAGDRDNDPASATPLADDGDGNITGEGTIATAGDVDWYQFTSLGSQFVRVDTVVGSSDVEEDGLDTVVTIYDAAGNLLAQEDEHPAGPVGTYDSVAFAYLADPGTYTVTVEDVQGRAEPDTGYTLTVRDMGAGGDEADSLQSAGYSLGVNGADSWYAIPVVLSRGDGTDDVNDYARIQLPWDDTFVEFVGTMSPNASELTPALTLYDAAGGEVMRKTAPTADDPAGVVNTEGQTYVLKVTDADGGMGPTYWAVLFALVRDAGYGNPREVEPNDTTPQTLAMVDRAPDVGAWVTGYGSGHIDTLGDVDRWSFTFTGDDAFLSVFYGAQTYGGLLLAHMDILDSAGAVVAESDAELGADAPIWNAGPVPAGTYTLVVEGTDMNPAQGEAAFYQFAVSASTSRLEP